MSATYFITLVLSAQYYETAMVLMCCWNAKCIIKGMHFKRPRPQQAIPADATRVLTGKIFDVYQWQQRLYDDTFVTFENLRRPDSVNVLPNYG